MNKISFGKAFLEYAATDRQHKVLSAVIQFRGNLTQAAKYLGITRQTVQGIVKSVRKRAARKNDSPEHDNVNPTAPGYMLKGTSTLYDRRTGDPMIQWVKTQVDWAEQWEAMEEALTAMFSEVPKARARKGLKDRDTDLLTLYPEGDPHWGMRVWGPETNGEHYDLAIALDEYYRATDWLVKQAPVSDTALILNVGDNFHVDNPENVTRRTGNHLQADGRLPKLFEAVIQARRYRVTKLLQKHNRVIMRDVAGNHDEIMTIGFRAAMKAYYSDDPRVTVEDTPNEFWYFQHGRCLFGATHGHKAKINTMIPCMAADVPELWGKTEFRHFYTGHMHHLERWEEVGGIVEMLRTLAARNEFEHGHGYRSKRDMICRVYHKDFGEVTTHRLSIRRIQAQ